MAHTYTLIIDCRKTHRYISKVCRLHTFVMSTSVCTYMIFPFVCVQNKSLVNSHMTPVRSELIVSPQIILENPPGNRKIRDIT